MTHYLTSGKFLLIIFLTRELTKIPHKKFILISSIDEAKDSPYGVTKRISEIMKGLNNPWVKDILDNEDILGVPQEILRFYLAWIMMLL